MRSRISIALFLLPIGLLFLYLTVGRYKVGFQGVVGALVGSHDLPPTARAVVLKVRLPRGLEAAVVGADLALAGALFQGMFRNPLVDSRILGVSAGAAFGAALAILWGLPWYLVDAVAFAFGLGAVWLVLFLSRRFGGSILVLVISGVLVGSLFSALLGLIKYVADPLGVLPAITYWLLGGLSGARWSDMALLLPLSLLGGGVLFLSRWRVNLLSLDEREALSLGVNVRRCRAGYVLLGTLLVAAAVSKAGIIGWVGLITPHAARALVGPDHARVIPASAALGASFLLLLDAIARGSMRTEIPLGVLTGIIGVPVFLLLFMRLLQGRGGWG